MATFSAMVRTQSSRVSRRIEISFLISFIIFSVGSESLSRFCITTLWQKQEKEHSVKPLIPFCTDGPQNVLVPPIQKLMILGVDKRHANSCRKPMAHGPTCMHENYANSVTASASFDVCMPQLLWAQIGHLACAGGKWETARLCQPYPQATTTKKHLYQRSTNHAYSCTSGKSPRRNYSVSSAWNFSILLE